MEVRGLLHTLAALPLWERIPLHIAQEAGWAPGPVWTVRRRVKSVAPAAIRTPQPPARKLRTRLTILSEPRAYKKQNGKQSPHNI